MFAFSSLGFLLAHFMYLWQQLSLNLVLGTIQPPIEFESHIRMSRESIPVWLL